MPTSPASASGSAESMAAPSGARLIVLVGLPGAGKSTAGRLAAQALGISERNLYRKLREWGRA